MLAPSPPPNRCQKMTSAVEGWPPVKLVATGEPQAESALARVTPPPAARNWRRDNPVIETTSPRSVMPGTYRDSYTANAQMEEWRARHLDIDLAGAPTCVGWRRSWCN